MIDTIKIGLTTLSIIILAPIWVPLYILGKMVEGIIATYYFLTD